MIHKSRCEACKDMKCTLTVDTKGLRGGVFCCVFCPFDGDAAEWVDEKVVRG